MHVTRVDLHCHSVHSDGAQTPREIAEHLAGGDVAAAALTDHNSVDGLEEFREALASHEIGFIPGVEVTAFLDGRELHLLGYGIDPTHAELLAHLASLRQASAPQRHSVAGSLRTRGSHPPNGASTPEGRLDAAKAISLIHRAGGRAFLAHPLALEADVSYLEGLAADLKALGLDGIEAIHTEAGDDDARWLCDMADRLGLLISAGSDLHERRTSVAGVAMPTDRWKAFRDAVCRRSPDGVEPAAHPSARTRPHVKWRHFTFRFAVPTLLAIALFIGAIFAVILPTFERSLLDRKREMIRELTNSAWSIMAAYERDERAGRLTRAQAQSLAASRIEALRYGSESKDYFWLQDMQPRIIMHPYRKDLNGRDVAKFRDPRGVAIFREFVAVVRHSGEGYAKYVWQWNDDPRRLVPKESYVKGFAPWGWIIGTGIYIEDVTRQIRRIERHLVQTSLVISAVVVLLLLYVIFESLRLERERAESEESLRESTERYRSLVEAATEGTLLVVGGRCRYANRTFLDMLGTTQRELEMLDLVDIFPESRDNEAAWTRLQALLRGEDPGGGFDATVRRRDGTLLDCVLVPSRIAFAERSGFILLARPVMPAFGADVPSGQYLQHLQQVLDEVTVGIFRARATSRGSLVAVNQAGRALLGSTDAAAGAPLSLADAFATQALYDEFLDDLRANGEADRRLHRTAGNESSRTLFIAATLTRDQRDGQRYIDGVVHDVTAQERRAVELQAVVERLQTSLLFLHEPISRIARSAAFCSLETPLQSAAELMSEQRTSALLVQSEVGTPIGIITDGDMRQRVVAAGLTGKEPAYRAMSSPLVSIPEHADIYEALLMMEERHIQHLAIADESGRIVGIIQNQELMQFRNYGPIVLTRQVERAATPEEVVRACRRVPDLARALLGCGARPHHVTHMISAVCNAATIRLITMAEADLGPPPVPYAFLSLGSQGRQEMTLASDQDNAILYQDPADDHAGSDVEAYLLAVGRFVCEWLDRAGYPLCKGDILAQTPRWCQPLSVWKRYFTEWIDSAEPQQLLEFGIFFDFHPVYGATELARELRRHLFEHLRERPGFYPHFAQNALQFRPPTRLLGRYVGGTAEHAGHLDLKEAALPIVSFARLYALRQESEATHTLDRLTELERAEVLPAASSEETTNAYEFLMRLRLQQQTAFSPKESVGGNSINPRRLGQSDQTLLHEAFAQILAIQQRISHDFLGGHGQV